VVVPAVAVDGVGALAKAVPPVSTVYHFKVFVPVAVAVNATAVVFWQYSIGAVTGLSGVF
jgi:hypothetical protein